MGLAPAQVCDGHARVKPWVAQPSRRVNEVAYPENCFGDDGLAFDSSHYLVHPPPRQPSPQLPQRRARAAALVLTGSNGVAVDPVHLPNHAELLGGGSEEPPTQVGVPTG